MKVVVTILQCRRAVLPHLFCKHVLPRMRRLVNGTVDVVIIQHHADASGGSTKLESATSSGKAQLAMVQQWTRAGRYTEAEIVSHGIVHPEYPSIPSVHLGVRAALDKGADFHLWLEDDAIVWDPGCGHWDALLGKSEVGVYRRFHNLNSAYLVTRPSFDERIVHKLADYRSWTWNQRLEPFLRRHLKTSRKHLCAAYAVRYHHRNYPYTGLRYLVDKVRELAPEDVDLLDVDFGPGCTELAPITQDDLAVDRARDEARLLARLGRVVHGAAQRYRSYREGWS